jgi:hypothetical protein
MWTPFSESAAAISRVAAGLMVDMSTTTAPASIAWITPSSPSRTALTSGVSLTQVTTTSAPVAASRGEAARAAPFSATGCSLSLVRLCTTRGKPAFRMCIAMGAPMVPIPINATFIGNLLGFGGGISPGMRWLEKSAFPLDGDARASVTHPESPAISGKAVSHRTASV